MEPWLDYAPRDFVLFSEEVYRRVFVRANAALHPAPLIAPVAGLALLAAALRLSRGPALAVAGLSAAWVCVSAGWMPLYAEINWAAAPAIHLFRAEAALLLLAALVAPRRPPTLSRSRAFAFVGISAGAILLFPLLAVLRGQPLAAAEVFAVAPDPTAIATLALLPLISRRLAAAVLGVIPLGWCLASGATLLALDDPQGWLPLAAGPALFAFACLPLKARGADGRAGKGARGD